MSQSWKMSVVESVVNVGVGYWVAVATQLLVFPLFGMAVDLTSNLLIGVIFTIVSLARSYLVRRLFNRVR